MSTGVDLDVETALQHQQKEAHRRLLMCDLADDLLNAWVLDISQVARLEGRRATIGEEGDDGPNADAFRRLSVKDIPDASVFSSPREEKKGKVEAVSDFLSPYLRYKMLKPYLKYVRSQEDGQREENTHSDQVRSIREHFDALTAMTPDEFAGEEAKEVEAEEKEEEEQEEVEEVVDGSVTDAGPVRPLRAGIAKSVAKKRKKTTKNKSAKTAKIQGEVDEKVNYENADYAQFYRAGGQKKGGASYDPWKEFGKKGKEGRGKKQKYKSGKSITYK